MSSQPCSSLSQGDWDPNLLAYHGWQPADGPFLLMVCFREVCEKWR